MKTSTLSKRVLLSRLSRYIRQTLRNRLWTLLLFWLHQGGSNNLWQFVLPHVQRGLFKFNESSHSHGHKFHHGSFSYLQDLWSKHEIWGRCWSCMYKSKWTGPTSGSTKTYSSCYTATQASSKNSTGIGARDPRGKTNSRGRTTWDSVRESEVRVFNGRKNCNSENRWKGKPRHAKFLK